MQLLLDSFALKPHECNNNFVYLKEVISNVYTVCTDVQQCRSHIMKLPKIWLLHTDSTPSVNSFTITLLQISSDHNHFLILNLH